MSPNTAADDSTKVLFLYDLFSYVNGYHLACWLRTPEFVQKVLSLMENHVCIDDKVLLDAMREIYDKKVEDKRLGVSSGFGFRTARRAMREVEKHILEYSNTNGR